MNGRSTGEIVIRGSDLYDLTPPTADVRMLLEELDRSNVDLLAVIDASGDRSPDRDDCPNRRAERFALDRATVTRDRSRASAVGGTAGDES